MLAVLAQTEARGDATHIAMRQRFQALAERRHGSPAKMVIDEIREMDYNRIAADSQAQLSGALFDAGLPTLR